MIERAGFETALALGVCLFFAFLAGRALASWAYREQVRRLRASNRLLRKKLRQAGRALRGEPRARGHIAYLRAVK